MTAAGIMRQYQVVGRKAATDENPNPEAYRMVIFAPKPVTTNKTDTDNTGGTLEDSRFTVYDEEREEIVTFVSICDLQRQLNNDT